MSLKNSTIHIFRQLFHFLLLVMVLPIILILIIIHFVDDDVKGIKDLLILK